jgi:hypothetical protein
LIVDEVNRRCIITPPHTASRHLHKSLCRQDGVYWLISPAPDGSGTWDHHGVHVSAEHRRFEVVLVVRDPIDRLRGLYRHLCNVHRERGMALPGWGGFLHDVYTDAKHVNWLFRWSISRLLGDVRPHVLIRFETLEQDVAAIYPDIHLLPKYDEPYAERWDPLTKWLAKEWSADDRKRWGYTCSILKTV